MRAIGRYPGRSRRKGCDFCVILRGVLRSLYKRSLMPLRVSKAVRNINRGG